MKTLIGIPTLNGPERLARCLAALGAHTDFSRGDVSVLVADDGSTPDQLEGNKQVLHAASAHVPGVEMLFGHGRTGIARTWNRIVRHGPTAAFPLIVLINDDVEVVPDWLDVLRYSLLHNPQAGMVGLNFYSGPPGNRPTPPPHPDYVEAHLQDGGGGLVSSFGPIFGFRREAWDLVGGFDERFFVFYEEVDFGVALGRRGFFHYMASHPAVFHCGGATNSDPQNLDAARCLAESRQKFIDKWGADIGQLREEFAARPGRPVPREWNQQVKVWP